MDTVGRNKKVIEEYIRNQIQDDIVVEQLSVMEYLYLFIGEEVNRKNVSERKAFEIWPAKVVRMANPLLVVL